MNMLYKLVAKQFPDLKIRLAQARVRKSAENYIKQTLVLSLFLALALAVIFFFFTQSFWPFVLLPLFYVIAFFYFMHYADALIAKAQKQVSKEIVFAGRFLIIELESGVPIYQAFQALARNYEHTGKYFAEIIERVDLGTSMEQSLNEAVQLAPSNDLRRMFWQVLNSLKTGSEVADALSSVFDQIVREQQISVKEYGRKLNPMAMFYMMVAIIIPSLGTIMLIVMSTFLGLDLNMLFFGVIVGANILIQLIFLTMIRAQRPPVDI